jgi:nicotinate-nucleotide adenylyltransferase
MAQRKLGLSEVWWLVSPHNPLKGKHEVGDYATRLAAVQNAIARMPRHKVCTLEAELGTRYTVDVVKHILMHRHENTQFVFLMGGDSFTDFHRWKKWKQIAAHIPLVVVPRGEFHVKGRAANVLRRSRAEQKTDLFTPQNTPQWRVLATPRHPAKAREMRQNKTIFEKFFLTKTTLSGKNAKTLGTTHATHHM